MRPLARATAMTSSSSLRNAICWPSVEAPRSNASVPMATFQPLFTPPTRWRRSARALSKKTSLNSLVPVTWRIGRISTPSWRSGIRK